MAYSVKVQPIAAGRHCAGNITVVKCSWEILQLNETEWEQEADLGYKPLVAHPPGCISPARPHHPEVLQPPRALPPAGNQISKNINLQGVFYTLTLTEYRFNKVCAEGVYIISQMDFLSGETEGLWEQAEPGAQAWLPGLSY